MAEDVKLSYHDYAAISLGDEAEGSWLFAQVAEAGKYFHDENFYAQTLPSDFQIKWLPHARACLVISTGQLLVNARLAYFGPVPAALVNQYGDIYEILRKGDYSRWPGYVNNGI